MSSKRRTLPRANNKLSAVVLLAVLPGCGAAPTPEPAAAADPPLSATTTSRPDLPAFPLYDGLSPAEREIVADILRARATTLSTHPVEVRLQPTLFSLCSDPADVDALSAKLTPLFQRKEDLVVNGPCRSATTLTNSGIGPASLRPQFVRSGNIDVEGLWGALMNAFPAACAIEVDSASLKTASADPLELSSHERRIPSSPGFSGIVMKEQVHLALERPTGTGEVQRVVVKVESDIYWRLKSAGQWTRVKTIEDLDPRWLGPGASTALQTCASKLIRAIAQ